MKTYLPDLVGATGVLLVGVGVWMIDPAWALIVLGLAIVYYAVLMAKPKGF